MRLQDVLDSAPVWHFFRWSLDLAFGVYRKRKALLQEWGAADGSVLDVACGIGQFSDATQQGYLGIDLNRDYIERAISLHRAKHIEFRCMDVKDLSANAGRANTVLLIGILHHLDEETARDLLAAIKALAQEQLIVMEVVQEQTNLFGRWIKNNDRGKYVRHQRELNRLVADAGFELADERIFYLGPTRTIATRWRPAVAG